METVSLRERTGRPRLCLLQAGPQLLHNLPEGLSRSGVRVLEDERLTRVASDHDSRVQRDSSEKRKPEFLRGRLAPAHLEDRCLFPAMGTDEAAHVLDHAEDIHLDRASEGD